MKRTLTLCACLACLPAVGASAGTSAAVREAEADARAAFKHGDYPTAIRLYEDCRTQTPNDPSLLANLGTAYFQDNQLDAAARHLRRSVELAPKEEFAYRALGIVYYWQRNDRDAIRVLEQAVTLNANDATAHKYLALAYTRQGDKRRAAAESEKARGLGSASRP